MKCAAGCCCKFPPFVAPLFPRTTALVAMAIAAAVFLSPRRRVTRFFCRRARDAAREHAMDTSKATGTETRTARSHRCRKRRAERASNTRSGGAGDERRGECIGTLWKPSQMNGMDEFVERLNFGGRTGRTSAGLPAADETRGCTTDAVRTTRAEESHAQERPWPWAGRGERSQTESRAEYRAQP